MDIRVEDGSLGKDTLGNGELVVDSLVARDGIGHADVHREKSSARGSVNGKRLDNTERT